MDSQNNTSQQETFKPPTQSVGLEAFRLQVEYAVDQGWIKPKSVEAIMAAYSQVAR